MELVCQRQSRSTIWRFRKQYAILQWWLSCVSLSCIYCSFHSIFYYILHDRDIVGWTTNSNLCRQLVEGTYGDTGTRSMCVSQYVYIPSDGAYSLSFYVGRISYPPPGSTVSIDSISNLVKFDGAYVAGSGVCGANGNTCPLKALDGINRYQAVTLTLNGKVGYRQLSICGAYTTPRRGTEDVMLIDKVSLYGPN